MTLNFIYVFGFITPNILGEFDYVSGRNANIFSSLTMLIFVMIELADIKRNGVKVYFRSLWKWIDLALLVAWYLYQILTSM